MLVASTIMLAAKVLATVAAPTQNTVQYAPYCIVLLLGYSKSAVLYCTVLYSTVLYCTVQYRPSDTANLPYCRAAKRSAL